MSPNHLLTPLTLPCGAVIKNRLVKSAMTERMTGSNLAPGPGHVHLYKKWADTGTGLLITGNVMVHPVFMESGGNVYVGDDKYLAEMKVWAAAATSSGHHAWTQISHAGRQTNRFATWRPKAPSEVQLKKLGLFGKPRAMTEADIQEVIQGFVRGAKLSQDAGFTGIQLHAAHGYLLNQFLSPRTNIRTDKWGGSLENRSRLLITVIDQIREAVGPAFPIGVKLNSSDFQRGGFTEEESLEVIRMLDGRIDMLEISGGTYEKMAFFGMHEDTQKLRASTLEREAYFLVFAEKVRAISKVPLLITGGFRSFDFCNQALANGELDFVGMARPFITNVDEIKGFLNGEVPKLENLVQRTGIKALDFAAEGGFYARQLIRLANGKKVNLKMSAVVGSVFVMVHELAKAIENRLGGR